MQATSTRVCADDMEPTLSISQKTNNGASVSQQLNALLECLTLFLHLNVDVAEVWVGSVFPKRFRDVKVVLLVMLGIPVGG